jgi:hypothetical protein
MNLELFGLGALLRGGLMILCGFDFEVGSEGVVLRCFAVVLVLHLLSLLLGVDEVLDSFYALEGAVEELADSGFVRVGVGGLGVAFLGFGFWGFAEMDGCVGVVAEGVALEGGGVSEDVLFLLNGCG